MEASIQCLSSAAASNPKVNVETTAVDSLVHSLECL